MKLTDKAIKAAKPEEKIKKLFDGNGLMLLVYPNGSKYWSAACMKMKDPHIVPLSSQVIAILRELQKHSGNRQHVM